MITSLFLPTVTFHTSLWHVPYIPTRLAVIQCTAPLPLPRNQIQATCPPYCPAGFGTEREAKALDSAMQRLRGKAAQGSQRCYRARSRYALAPYALAIRRVRC
eukprot:394317-Rhodomonas_salina.1